MKIPAVVRVRVPGSRRRLRRAAGAVLTVGVVALTACGSDVNSGRAARDRGTSTVPSSAPTSTSTPTPAPTPSSTPTAAASDGLTVVLQRAVREERHAEATYRNVIAALGSIRPFTNIADSEATHVAALVGLADRYRVDVTAITSAGEPSPATRTAACRLGVTAEQADVALYDELLPQVTAYPDVTQVLQNLRAASQDQHLPAFQQCA
jgi:hypothetical protein